MKKFLALAFAGALFIPSAFAANSWNGTWKLDQAKSHLTGTTFTYSKAANGMWHISDGGNFQVNFAPNGKPYATLDAEDTMTVIPQGSHTLLIGNQFKGKTLSTTREVLSADGKTLTDHTTGKHPDGSAINDTTVMVRVGAGSGFFGTWKSTEVHGSSNSYNISTASDGTLSWDISAEKIRLVGKPDGSPMQVTGPTVSPAISFSMKKAGPGKLDYWMKLKGKPISEGNMTLSADGKWLTDTSWTPGKSDQKTTGVYARQ